MNSTKLEKYLAERYFKGLSISEIEEYTAECSDLCYPRKCIELYHLFETEINDILSCYDAYEYLNIKKIHGIHDMIQQSVYHIFDIIKEDIIEKEKEIELKINRFKIDFYEAGELEFLDDGYVSEDFKDIDWNTINTKLKNEMSNTAFDINYDDVEQFCNEYELEFDDIKAELYKEFLEGYKDTYYEAIRELRR